MNKIYACYSYLTKYFPNSKFVFEKLAFLSQPDFLVKAKAILQHLNIFEAIYNAIKGCEKNTPFCSAWSQLKLRLWTKDEH